MAKCDGCEIMIIQGVKCHEFGCPNAWQDKMIWCLNCHEDFIRDKKGQVVCIDCMDDLNMFDY